MALDPIYGGASYGNSLAADTQSLGRLKMDAGKATPESIKETAKQFESLFMRELMKSMREATMKSGMLDNSGSDLGTDLLDQQFAVQMSGQPGGLSDMIARQLAQQSGVTLPGIPAPVGVQRPTLGGVAGATGAAPIDGSTSGVTPAGVTPAGVSPINSRAMNPAPAGVRASEPLAAPIKSVRATSSQASFVSKHSEVANRVERDSGIPASFMMGQAGHETGWGKFEIKMKGGAPSYNLFGIKAGAGWKGKVAEVTTTEYVNGVAEKRVAKFRAYESYEDSFRDYARLISETPRYAKVKAQTGSVHAFASGLQKAGYATDPEYASKLSRAINTTLQLRRVQV